MQNIFGVIPLPFDMTSTQQRGCCVSCEKKCGGFAEISKSNNLEKKCLFCNHPMGQHTIVTKTETPTSTPRRKLGAYANAEKYGTFSDHWSDDIEPESPAETDDHDY